VSAPPLVPAFPPVTLVLEEPGLSLDEHATAVPSATSAAAAAKDFCTDFIMAGLSRDELPLT
jgi:hypothetical protein